MIFRRNRYYSCIFLKIINDLWFITVFTSLLDSELNYWWFDDKVVRELKNVTV
jgi:hypothetical protein